MNKRKRSELLSAPAEVTKEEGSSVRQADSWNGIVGLDEAKRVLFEACMLPTLLPASILSGIRAVPSSVLLYGPPGAQ